jgi:2-polyprenyl-3-methyl-5-hydroxy-6-metoxy-1,4-benzoquinol methylase
MIDLLITFLKWAGAVIAAALVGRFALWIVRAAWDHRHHWYKCIRDCIIPPTQSSLDEKYLLSLKVIIRDNSAAFFSLKNKLLNEYIDHLNVFEEKNKDTKDEKNQEVRVDIDSFKKDYEDYKIKGVMNNTFLADKFIRVLKLTYDNAIKKIPNENEREKYLDLLLVYRKLIERLFKYNIKTEDKKNINLLLDDIEYLYIDINDAKLQRDIKLYEPYPGYWNKSDRWIRDEIIKSINKYRKKEKNINILDIGCGDGTMVDALTANNDNIYIIEPDKNRYEKAKIRLRHKSQAIKSYSLDPFLVAAEGFNDNFFDIILCSHVIQHINTDEAKMFMSAIYKKLKSGGLFFLLNPISKSKWDEYVVEGLEYEVLYIPKRYLKSLNKGIQIDDSLVKYFTEHGFKLSNDNWYIEPKDKDIKNGYWKITNKDNKSSFYEFICRENSLRAYKKMPYLGLQLSLPKDFIPEFNNSIISDRLKNAFPYTICDNAQIVRGTLPNHWIIFCDELCKQNFQLIAVREKNTIKILLILEKIPLDNILDLECNTILEQFKKFKLDNLGFTVEKKSSSVWHVIDQKTNAQIASIYKTINFLALTNSKALPHEINIHNLGSNQIIKEILNAENIHNNHIRVDPEKYDYWAIRSGNDVFIVRDDYDWIKIFKCDHVFYELIQGSISAKYRSELCPMKIAEGSKVTCQKDRSDEWYISQHKPVNKEQPVGFPNYTILKFHINNRDVFIAYRDKRYSWISKDTFNSLCALDSNYYKILPTRHFSWKTLRSILNDFNIRSFKFYHLFYPNKYSKIYDKIFLRDYIYNSLTIIRRLIWMLRKFKVQNVLLVMKKDITKKGSKQKLVM